MRLRLKRSLYLVHRWLGVGMCVLFALWFATGVIMMYVEYPELTEQERLATLPPLDLASVAVPVEQAAAASGLDRGLASVTLTSIGSRPAYVLRGADGGLAAIYADDGRRFAPLSVETAVDAVARSGFAEPGAAPRYDGAIDMDQWTVSSVLDEHRPLQRVHVGDRRGTVVYLSSATGQIVRDTNRAERGWNWLGSTIHWIYPFQLRRHGDLWSNLLIYLSLAGVISVATGGVIGVLRLRVRQRYRGTDMSPYRGAAKWHHVLGLVGFVFISTFIFSGLMSMSPWGLFDSKLSQAEEVDRYTGGSIRTFDGFPPVDARTLSSGVKEVEWRQIAGAGHLVASRTAQDREVLVAGLHGPAAANELRRRIESALPALVGGAAPAARVLSDYDAYYYSRHNRYRPLPAYEAKFADAESTWFYVDATTGAVVLRYTKAERVLRWLYNGLHSLDFPFLLRHGALWDGTVVVITAFGFVFAVTALIVAWRRVLRGTVRVLTDSA
jgi:hypothetical protein